MKVTVKFPPKLDSEVVEQKNRKGIWVDAGGGETPVSKLTDLHLHYIERALIRRAHNKLARNRTFYLTCPEPHGEMAQDVFDSEFMFWTDYDDDKVVDLILNSYPFWAHLKAEKQNRERLRSLTAIQT